MATPGDDEARTLRLDRVLNAPRDKVFACWTQADLLKQFFCPKPWWVGHAAMDFRTGGWNEVDMHGPDGAESKHRAVWLEIVPGERIVFTDAFVRAWLPSQKPFIVATIDFADAGDGRTELRCTVRHWSAEDCRRHVEMGFFDGWGAVMSQLEELARVPATGGNDRPQDMETTMSDNSSERMLTLTRIMDAPRETLFRCWTEPELMKQWFCPRPWTTPVIEVDLRPGGKSFIKMRGPEGEEHDNHGIYLEVIPNEKLVFTDAFIDTWTPSDRAFMVAEVTFEDAGDGKTKYTAIARHWSVEATKEHEAMGFHEGWGKAADQLEETAKSL